MRPIRFLLLLIILPLLIMTCSKKEDEEFVPDLTKNAFYINSNEYLLSDGLVANSGGEGLQESYDYQIILFSSGISFDTSYSFDEGLNGIGNAISIEITTDLWDGPQPGTYSTDNEEGEQKIEDLMCVLNFNTGTWGASNMYYFPSAAMSLRKEGDEYEITINAIGVEFNIEDDDEIINDNIQMAAHYKGILPECDFITEDPSVCKFDVDTMDFTFGIDYDDPAKYLVPGEESDLSDDNLKIVRDAIGTPSANIDGIMQVCHWINQNFTFSNAGGAMAGENTVDELFEIRTFYGCHSLALIISSVLREFGFPAVMIETADVQWGYDFRAGTVDYFAGHVMSEIYVNNKWILLDNNCTYVSEYDCTNPFISMEYSNQGGLFVFAKGVDIWDYRGGNELLTDEKLLDFSNNVHCYEDLFNTTDYDWNN